MRKPECKQRDARDESRDFVEHIKKQRIDLGSRILIQLTRMNEKGAQKEMGMEAKKAANTKGIDPDDDDDNVVNDD